MIQIQTTPISDLLIIQPQIFPDNRGYFLETYNQKTFQEVGIKTIFVQDNQSFSKYGVIRGLHFQKPPFEQAKLVRAVKGEILDVAVDLRPDSETYKQHFKIILSEENQNQLFIPRGFAHGFAVLSRTAILAYKCDNFYNGSSDGGIRFNDPSLNIDWQIPKEKMVVSKKDLELPYL